MLTTQQAIRHIVITAVLVMFMAPLSAWSQDPDKVADSRLQELKQFTRGDDRQREQPPAIDKPHFISVTDASLSMDLNAIVFVEEPHKENGRARIYPRRIMAHHEVANIREGKTRRSITYCPLTGSIIGFRGKLNSHETTFGTMGMITNSNRIFYDRATNSHWPQLLGAAMSGPLKGERLQTFPLLWTKWKQAREVYPDAKVLSKQTGYDFRYGRDPYGSYQRKGTYYTDGPPYFPLAHMDKTMHPKQRIIGITWKEDAAAAVVHEAVKKEKAVYMDRGLDPVVALYDQRLDAVRVFFAFADGRPLEFITVHGEIVDKQTRSRWSHMGVAYEGRLRGMRLERVATYETMWFAWKAFHPYSEVWGKKYARPFKQ